MEIQSLQNIESARLARSEVWNDRDFLHNLEFAKENGRYIHKNGYVFSHLLSSGYGLVIETPEKRYFYEPGNIHDKKNFEVQPESIYREFHTVHIKNVYGFLKKLDQLQETAKEAKLHWASDRTLVGYFIEATPQDLEQPEVFIDKFIYGLGDKRLDVLERSYKGALLIGKLETLQESGAISKAYSENVMETPFELRFATFPQDRNYSLFQDNLPVVRYITTGEHSARIYAIQLEKRETDVNDKRSERLKRFNALLKDLWGKDRGNAPVGIISLVSSLAVFEKIGITDIELPLLAIKRVHEEKKDYAGNIVVSEEQAEDLDRRIFEQKIALLKILPKALPGMQIIDLGDETQIAKLKITDKLKSPNKLLQEILDLIDKTAFDEDS